MKISAVVAWSFVFAVLIGCGKASDPSVSTSKAPPAKVTPGHTPASLFLKRRVPGERDFDANDFHAQFRKEFPFHMQTIVVSGGKTDRVLIVSEPPPHVALADLREILGEVQVKKHRIGVDGWVKDVVGRAPFQDSELAPIVSKLSQLLYGTAYKAYVLELPRPKPAQYDLDLDVRAEEIREWLLAGNNKFSAVDGGNPLSVAEILKTTASTVYFSERPGLVMWWIPKGVAVSELKPESRQFALDSDLLVGGVAKQNGILVVGRERQVPVDVLPPLRHETIQLLASAETRELAQSYERNNPLAGRRNKSGDWAPILLSRELVDTEYGSLLNITDQLLKGWSMSGRTVYDNFPYPEPADYPFKNGLQAFLNNPPAVTFNWNTTGAGYEVASNGVSIYALHRTGALPVSYFPEGLPNENASQVSKAEDIGAAFYAGKSDPNLARVVQYAALYQLFRNHSGSITKDPVVLHEDPRAHLADLTVEVLEDVSAVLKKASDKLPAKTRSESKETRSLIALGSYVRQSRSNLRKMAQAVATASGVDQVPILKDTPTLGKALLSLAAAEAKLPMRYSELSQTDRGWIHTPVVVFSTNNGWAAKSVGGHNLGTRIIKFELSDLPDGVHFKRGGDGSIIVNRSDSGRIAKLNDLMARGHKLSRAELETEFNSIISEALPPVRQVQPALKVASGGNPPPNGPGRGCDFKSPDPDGPGPGGPGGPRGMGWEGPGPFDRGPFLAFLKTKRQQAAKPISVEKTDSGYVVAFDDHAIPCRNIEDAVDIVSQANHRNQGPEDSVLFMRNMDLREAKNFSDSANKRILSGKGSREIISILEDTRGWNPKLANSPPRYQKLLPIRNADGRFEVEVRATLPKSQGGNVESRATIEYTPTVSEEQALQIATLAETRLDKASHLALKRDPTSVKLGMAVQAELRKLQKETKNSIMSVHNQLLEGAEKKSFTKRKNRKPRVA